MPKEDHPDDILNNLRKIILKLKKEVKRLKSENSTLKNAWNKTESYLIAISKDKTIKEIFDELESKTFTRTIKMKCKKCDNNTMNKRQFDNYFLVYCSKCGYRNRINDNRKV